MLQISPSNLTQMEHPFRGRLADYLAQRYASAAEMPRDTLLDWVKMATLNAARAGFEAEQHQCDFAEALWCEGSEMLSHPDYTRIVAHEFSTPEDKAVRLRRAFVREGVSNG